MTREEIRRDAEKTARGFMGPLALLAPMTSDVLKTAIDTFAGIIAAEREKAARLERERDEERASAERWRSRYEGERDTSIRLERERDAYKRAKAENDERFMIERDTARRERDELAAQLAALREAAAYINATDLAPRVTFYRDGEASGHRVRYGLIRALAASAPAVEAYARRVQAEALESAATVFRGNQKRCEARLPDEIVDVADARREALAEAWCAAASECEARARDLRGGR